MEDGKQQPRRISVHAKAKSFDFKFRVTKILLAWASSSRLSFLLRFRAFSLQVKSESEPAPFKSKFKRALGKFRTRRRRRVEKNQTPAAQETSNLQNTEETKSPIIQLGQLIPEEPICVSPLIIGGVTLVSQWIYRIEGISIIMYSFGILLCLTLLHKKFMTSKFSKLLLISFAALLACSIMFDLKTRLGYVYG